MKITNLNYNQIITSSHDVLHNLHVLKIYFRIFQKRASNILPPSPVIHKDKVVKYFNRKLNKKFQEFAIKHPKAEYFLLDGSHKTTAANLTLSKCKVMIFENQKDVLKSKEMEKTGEIFQYLLGNNIQEVIKSLLEHFNEKQKFQTVQEKTQKLIQKKLIPRYMIKYYKKR